MKRADILLWLDESNVIFRRGMADCLAEAGYAIVGESAHLVPEPDLDAAAVLVVELDRAAALAGAARIAANRGMHLLGVLDAGSSDLMYDAAGCGFAGLLIRSEMTPDALVAAVGAVACGTGSIPPAVLVRLLTKFTHSPGLRPGMGLLARRELDVLRLLAEGGSTREIAGALCYSERTVKNIVHDTLAKLNCRTRAHAVAVVVRQGVL